MRLFRSFGVYMIIPIAVSRFVWLGDYTSCFCLHVVTFVASDILENCQDENALHWDTNWLFAASIRFVQSFLSRLEFTCISRRRELGRMPYSLRGFNCTVVLCL